MKDGCEKQLHQAGRPWKQQGNDQRLARFASIPDYLHRGENTNLPLKPGDGQVKDTYGKQE